MRFFIDSASPTDIRHAASLGVICGVTTNPTLMAREGRDVREVLQEIAALVEGPISAEVDPATADAAGMVHEARLIAQLHPNMVVKLPMTAEGLQACRMCRSEGIRTNLTLIFSANQALLAARAGADYVSPFMGRLDDISACGTELIRTIVRIFRAGDISAQIICASVRHPAHVLECALAGADIATVPLKVLEQMISHPLTERGLAQFQADAGQGREHG